jgi:hypothetical protein
MTPAEELALVRHELERLCHQRLVGSFDPATRARYVTLTKDELTLMRLLQERSPVDP